MTKTKKWTIGCGIPLLLIVSLLASLVYSIFSTPEYRIARDPEKIATLADFELPEYKVVSKTNNMDRTSSAWSDYTWSVQIKTPVEKDVINSLNHLVNQNQHWTYEPQNKTYHYKYPDIDPSEGYVESAEISISVNVLSGIVILDYTWWDMWF